MVYVTVYVPGVLVDGVIAPVDELMVKPGSEVKLPPRVPVIVAFVAASEVQRGGYEIVAMGAPLMVTVVVVIKFPQPPVPGTVYWIV